MTGLLWSIYFGEEDVFAWIYPIYRNESSITRGSVIPLWYTHSEIVMKKLNKSIQICEVGLN